MSELSKEAQGAAAEMMLLKRNLEAKFADIIQQSIDAAIAKLRAGSEKQVCDLQDENAKLRAEYAALKADAARSFQKRIGFELEAAKLRDEIVEFGLERDALQRELERLRKTISPEAAVTKTKGNTNEQK